MTLVTLVRWGGRPDPTPRPGPPPPGAGRPGRLTRRGQLPRVEQTASASRPCPGSTTFTQAAGANSAVVGPPGVTLEISTSNTCTVGGSVSASASVSADAVVASVSAEVGVTVSQEYSATTSTSGAFTVPAEWTNGGRLALGANVYSEVVTTSVENRACVLVDEGSANFSVPGNEWVFQTTQL